MFHECWKTCCRDEDNRACEDQESEDQDETETNLDPDEGVEEAEEEEAEENYSEEDCSEEEEKKQKGVADTGIKSKQSFASLPRGSTSVGCLWMHVRWQLGNGRHGRHVVQGV